MDTSSSILTIFAHQDDETFSAGGTLATHNHTYALSVTSDPKRKEEFEAACEVLKTQPILLDNKNVEYENFSVIKMQVIDKIREIKPTHIITHLANDYHFEHKLVRQIVEEAIEWASHTTSIGIEAHQVDTLLEAETTILLSFPQIFIDITEVNELRMNAIQIYESQSHKGGDGFYSEFHFTRTRLRGIQAGSQHAEAFNQVPIAKFGSFKPTKHLKKLF